MSDSTQATTLQDFLGQDCWSALTNPGNRQAVKAFSQTLVPPKEIRIRDSTYEILSFLEEGETEIDFQTLLARAKKLGDEWHPFSHVFLRENQAGIPPSLQNTQTFVFPHSTRRNEVLLLAWLGHGWCFKSITTDSKWNDRYRLIRRKVDKPKKAGG